MAISTKTDNHNPAAKLELRRYFLRRYPAAFDVFDCCQGEGLLWAELRSEFKLAHYLGVDLKAKKGRLKIDSARILDQPGWTFNVIDVDTYGAPWKHWFALLKHAPNESALTVFLTIGIVNIGGISSRADSDTCRALGIDSLFARMKSRGATVPPSLTGLARDRLGFAACICAAENFGFKISELIESENDGGHARYIGARLNRAAQS